MRCIGEKELEKFVIDHLLSGENSPEIQEHLLQCSFCQERYDLLLEEFKLTLSTYTQEFSTDIEAVAQELAPNKPLTAHYLEPENFAEPLPPPYPLLAAESEVPTPPGNLENLGSFATHGGDVLVRALRNTETGEVTLHILAEEPRKYRNVLVKIKGLEGEFPSDNEGIVHLGPVQLPPLKDTSLEIKTPLSTFKLEALAKSSTTLPAQWETLLRNEADDSIKIIVEPNEGGVTLKVQLLKIGASSGKSPLKVMVTHGNQETLIRGAQQRIAVFEKLQPQGELVIHIFE